MAAAFPLSLQGLIRTTGLVAASTAFAMTGRFVVPEVTLGSGEYLTFFYRGNDPATYTQFVWVGLVMGQAVQIQTPGGNHAVGPALAAGEHTVTVQYDPATHLHTCTVDHFHSTTFTENITAWTITHELIGTDTYADSLPGVSARRLRQWTNGYSTMPTYLLGREANRDAAVLATGLWGDWPLVDDLDTLAGSGGSWTALGGEPDGVAEFEERSGSTRWYGTPRVPNVLIRDQPLKGDWNSGNAFGGFVWSPTQYTFKASTSLDDSTFRGPIAGFSFNQTAQTRYPFLRWQFGPFAACTVDTLFDLCWYARAMFENVGLTAQASVSVTLHIYIGVGQTAAVRTVLLDTDVDTAEFRKNSIPWFQSLSAPKQLGPAALFEGDCIIVETGFAINSQSSSPATLPASYPPIKYTSIVCRNTGGLPADLDGVPGEQFTNSRPWFQFSQTFAELPTESVRPVNDTCAAAVAITMGPDAPYESDYIDTTESIDTERGVFFTWTAPATGRVLFTAYGSNYNVILSAFTNGCTQTISPDAFARHVRNGPHSTQSLMAFDATEGASYLIRARNSPTTLNQSESGGILRIQGFYQQELEEDDLLLPAGPLAVFRGTQMVSASLVVASAVPTGIALDYTLRPVESTYGEHNGEIHTGVRVLLGLFPFTLVEILVPEWFSTGSEEIDYINNFSFADHIAQLYVTAAGRLTATSFGNGFLDVRGDGSASEGLPAQFNAPSSVAAYSAFQTIDATAGDNQGASDPAVVQPPVVEVTAPWCLSIDEENDIAYYTSGSLYLPVGGQTVRRYDLANSLDLGVFATLPTRDVAVPAVRGLQYIGNGNVLVCNGDVVHRLDSSGDIVQTFTPSIPLESQSLIDVKLTADGTAFWVVDLATAHLFKFDLSTGEELLEFATFLTPGSLVQMAIFQPTPFTPPADEPCVMGVVSLDSVEARPSMGCIGGHVSSLRAVDTTMNTARLVIGAVEALEHDGGGEGGGGGGGGDTEDPLEPTVTEITIVGGPFTYTGDPIEPAVVSVTGAGLSLSPEAEYTDNVEPGEATASYSYPGDEDYLPSSKSKHFTIGKAPTVTVVTIAGGPFVYDGAAKTPASVAVTGPGLSLTPSPTYANNTNAGTANASYSYPGAARYLPSSDSENFTIAKAPTVTTVVVSGGPFTETGDPIEPATVTVTGPGGLSLTPAAEYDDNVLPGTATARYSYPGDANYLPSSDSETFEIEDDPEIDPDPPGDPTLLAPADLEYEGMFRLPFTASDKVPFEVRDNDGTPTLLFFDNVLKKLYETTFPGVGLDRDTSPRATLLRDFGDVTDDVLTTGVHNTENGVTFNGMSFDPTNPNRLWGGYRCAYPAGGGAWNPSIFSVDLDFDAETHVTRGPWITEDHGDRTNGYFLVLPEDWADEHNGGRRLCAGAAQGSVNQQCPVGPYLTGLELIDPTAVPADEATGDPMGDFSIGAVPMIQHDATHPAPRDPDYRVCGWAVPGNLSVTSGAVAAGSTVIPMVDTTLYAQPGSYLDAFGAYYAAPQSGASPFLYAGRSTPSGPGNLTGVYTSTPGDGVNGAIPAGTGIELANYDDGKGFFNELGEATWNNYGYRVDTFAGFTWVETGSKRGLVGCGYMVGEREGVTYADGPSPHVWYAPEGRDCPHAHDAGAIPGTGQKSDPPQGRLFFYNPEHVAQSVAGARDPWSLTPVVKNLAEYEDWAGAALVTKGWQYQNIKFHQPTRRIFLLEVDQTDAAGGQRPYVHCFRVPA